MSGRTSPLCEAGHSWRLRCTHSGSSLFLGLAATWWDHDSGVLSEGGRNVERRKAVKVSIYLSDGIHPSWVPTYTSILDFLFYRGVSGATVLKKASRGLARTITCTLPASWK